MWVNTGERVIPVTESEEREILAAHGGKELM
jgi:hypothetical protein